MRLESCCLAVATALVLLAACGEEKPETRDYRQPPRILTEAPPIEPIPEDAEPSELIGRFRSLMTLEQAVAVTGDLPFQVNMDQRTENRGTCPGQHMIKLSVTRFWDLDRKGTLHLTFFDDVLTRARFMTFDVEGYRVAFFAKHEIERRNRWQPTYIQPGTVIKNPVAGNEGMLVEDMRAIRWADSVEKACRYQWQKERGWTGETS
jgi:hypothetical protein